MFCVPTISASSLPSEVDMDSSEMDGPFHFAPTESSSQQRTNLRPNKMLIPSKFSARNDCQYGICETGSTGSQGITNCLGTMSFGNMAEWTLEIHAARPIVNRALDLGINFFDTANIYSWGNLRRLSVIIVKEHRDQAVIATKVRGGVGEGPNDTGLSRYHIMREVQKSLKRLGTDHIDLYHIDRWDNDTPIEENLLTMN